MKPTTSFFLVHLILPYRLLFTLTFPSRSHSHFPARSRLRSRSCSAPVYALQSFHRLRSSSFASPCHSLVHCCRLTSASPILHHTLAASASSLTYTSTDTTAGAPHPPLRGLVRNASTLPRTPVGAWMYLSCASCSRGLHQRSVICSILLFVPCFPSFT